MNKEQLTREIKELIIETLDLEDIKPEDIDAEKPLFVDGLGLDSIDALELGMALKKKYQINFKSQDGENKKHFSSVSTLTDFILENK